MLGARVQYKKLYRTPRLLPLVALLSLIAVTALGTFVTAPAWASDVTVSDTAVLPMSGQPNSKTEAEADKPSEPSQIVLPVGMPRQSVEVLVRTRFHQSTNEIEMFIKYKNGNGDFKDLKYGSSDERKVTKAKATDAWAEIPCVELPNWSCVSPSVYYLSQGSQYVFAVTVNGSGERLPGKSSWVYSAAEFEGKNGLADKGKRLFSQGWKETGAGGGTFATIAPLSAKNCVGLEPDNGAEFTPSSTVVAVNGRRYHVGVGVMMFPVCTANPIHLEDAWEAAFTAQVWRKLSDLDGMRKTDSYKAYENAHNDYKKLAQGKAALRELFTFTVKYAGYLKDGKLGSLSLLMKRYVKDTVKIATERLYDDAAVEEAVGELKEAWEDILSQTVEIGVVLKAIENGEKDWEAGANCGNHCKLDFDVAEAIFTTYVLIEAADGLLKPVVAAAHKVRAIKDVYEIGEEIGGVLAGFLIHRGKMTKDVARSLGLNVGTDTHIDDFNTAFDRFKREMPKRERSEFSVFLNVLDLGKEARYEQEGENSARDQYGRGAPSEEVMPKTEVKQEGVEGAGERLATPADAAASFELNVWASPMGSGRIRLNPNNFDLEMSVNAYARDTKVLVIAQQRNGWRFVKWGGGISGSRNPIEVTMDADKAVWAVFEWGPTMFVSADPADGRAGWVEVLNGTGSIQGQRRFERSEVARIRAHTNVGWRFTGWSGDASGSSPTTTVLMNGDRKVTANWAREQATLTLHAIGEGTITLDGKEYGGRHVIKVDKGNRQRLTAIPESGHHFSAWIAGNTVEFNHVIDVQVDTDTTIVANFFEGNKPSVTLRIEAGKGGTVEPTAGNTLRVPRGSRQPVAATPEEGYYFTGWAGSHGLSDADKVEPEIWLDMDRDRRVIAQFKRGSVPGSGVSSDVKRTLYIEKTPAAGGRVTLSPYAGTGNEYAHGTTVTVTARPSTGYRFVRWEGDRELTRSSVSVRMDGDKRLRAVFESLLTQPTLTVSAQPAGGEAGWIEVLNGTGSTSGQRLFQRGETARIRAHTNAGWRFTGWSGDASGTSVQVNVTMNGDKRVMAHWQRAQAQPGTYTLTVSANPSGGAAGYVEIVGGSGNTPGQRDFASGQSARIVAHTNAGWRFTGWSGDASGGSVQTNVTMNGDKRVTAHWERVQAQPGTYTLTVSANPSGGAAGLRGDRGR